MQSVTSVIFVGEIMSENCKQCGRVLTDQDEDGLCIVCRYKNEAINQHDDELEERRLGI